MDIKKGEWFIMNLRRQPKGEAMIGAIVGDIVGSRFEFDNHKLETLHSFESEFQ